MVVKWGLTYGRQVRHLKFQRGCGSCSIFFCQLLSESKSSCPRHSTYSSPRRAGCLGDAFFLHQCPAAFLAWSEAVLIRGWRCTSVFTGANLMRLGRRGGASAWDVVALKVWDHVQLQCSDHAHAGNNLFSAPQGSWINARFCPRRLVPTWQSWR